MENIKISVIMPVHNTKKRRLKQSIESVLKQTYEFFELIIIDSDSDFKTKKILKSYTDERIIIIENKTNPSLSQSLNIGLDVASGKYIVEMNPNRIMLPNRLEHQLTYMEKNENIGVSACAYVYKKEEYIGPNGDAAIKEQLKRGVFPYDDSALMIRKEVLGDIRYSETFIHNENLFLLTKLIDKTEFQSLKKPLIKKRRFEKKPSKKYLEEQALNNQTIIYLNMEKFYEQACGEEFSIIRKLKDKKRITTREFKKLFEKNSIIDPNIHLEKIARKRCINPLVKFGFIKLQGKNK